MPQAWFVFKKEVTAYFASPVAYIVMLGTACMGFWTAVRAGGGGR